MSTQYSTKYLDGTQFVHMVLTGHSYLETNKEHVNALNVFPVPDGDTGTNMLLSLSSGVAEMKKVSPESLGKLAHALSAGLLMGARGNSGVILSQLFRGFSKEIGSADRIDAKKFADCLQSGVSTAYQAVVKPVEGTILTVAKDAARAAVAAAKQTGATIVSIMKAALDEAERSLQRTPDLLHILKQAGVVDSGGQGLVYIYRGFLAGLRGEAAAPSSAAPFKDREALMATDAHDMAAAHFDMDIEHGYCTEFIIHLDVPRPEEEIEREIRKTLDPEGDSMVVVAADNLVKVHIHAERPGIVLEKAMRYGSLTRIKIDNMREQHQSLSSRYGSAARQTGTAVPVAVQQKKPFGIVTVSAGTGLANVFKSLGVDVVIEGGQTMNPSTEDIIRAVQSVQAEHVFVLPNNSNIILAAEQARSILGDHVTVIPTQSVPQGIAAAIVFDPAQPLDANRKDMQDAAGRVKSGQVTKAVRDSHFQGMEIKEGDYMGMLESKVVTVGADRELVASQLLERMIDGNTEIVTVISGKDVPGSEAERFVSLMQSRFAHTEFEWVHGGQPLYDYLFAVE
jgi:DAK2 domain fusion protein YloV